MNAHEEPRVTDENQRAAETASWWLRVILWCRRSRSARLMLVILVGLAVLVGISLHGKQDSDTAHDLYTIQAALVQQYSQTGALPRNLGQLHIKSLKRALSNYQYTPSIDADAVTANVQLCANFASANTATPYTGAVDNSVAVYDYHHKGLQCYSDDIYKSQPHIVAQ